MSVKVYFSFWEVVILTVSAVVFKLMLLYPLLIVRAGQTAAILTCVVISVAATLVFMLILNRYEIFKGKNIFTVTGDGYGKFVKSIVAIIIAAFYLGGCALTLRQVTDSLIAVCYPNAGMLPIMLLFAFAMGIAALIGLKAVVRLHTIIAPVIWLFLLLIFVMTASDFDISNIFPLFGSGLPSFTNSMLYMGFFADVLVMFIISERIEKNISFPRVAITSILLSAAFLIMIIAMYTLTVPYPANTKFFIPLYQLERFFSLGDYLKRAEFLFTLTWSLAFFLNMATQFYCLCFSFCRISGAASYKGAIIPLAVLVVFGSLIPRDINQVIDFMPMLTFYGIIAAFIVPLAVFALNRKGA